MTVDRWEAMRLHLDGQAMPTPPALPGRRHQPLAVPDESDETAAAWEAVNGVWTPPPESPRWAWMRPGADDAAA